MKSIGTFDADGRPVALTISLEHNFSCFLATVAGSFEMRHFSYAVSFRMPYNKFTNALLLPKRDARGLLG
jgi:hypothetical protein